MTKVAESAGGESAAGLRRLVDRLARPGRVVVGYSGGVDSAFLLWAATRVLGKDAVLAVTGVSPSLSREQLDEAVRQAGAIDAPHRLLETREAENPDYLANAPDRCYHCKTELYSRLVELARTEGFDRVLDGSNLDDTRDIRPGFRAIRERDVESPLLDAALSKETIRTLSRAAGLAAWDRPASPCLSSRVPHGIAITAPLLARIEAGEAYLRTIARGAVRLRSEGDHARIEVEPEEVGRMLDPDRFTGVRDALLSLGYTTVAIDPNGYRQGGANLPRPRPLSGGGDGAEHTIRRGGTP